MIAHKTTLDNEQGRYDSEEPLEDAMDCKQTAILDKEEDIWSTITTKGQIDYALAIFCRYMYDKVMLAADSEGVELLTKLVEEATWPKYRHSIMHQLLCKAITFEATLLAKNKY